MNWQDKNSGKHPADPDYDRDYDAEEDFRRWEDEQDLKEMYREGN